MSGRGVSTKEVRVWREACEGRVSVRACLRRMDGLGACPRRKDACEGHG